MRYVKYIVRQGDYLNKIAVAHGIADATAIYNDKKNEELRALRPNPNILYPGDVVWIPVADKIAIPTQAIKPGVRVIEVPSLPRNFLQFRFLTPSGKPRKNLAYKIEAGSERFSGTTDGSGLTQQHYFSGDIEDCKVTLGEKEVYECKIGYLDPIDTISGIQGRLNSLGFDCGPVDGILGPSTQAAIEKFQSRYELEVDGILGPETKAKLKEVYGY